VSDIHTPRRRELVSRIADLGPTIAARADRYDREASFPHENFADLRSAGFLALCIPEEHGGLGADFTTYALVSEELGRHCGSTALTFNMHTATMILTGQIADELTMSDADREAHDRRRTAMWRGVVDDGHIHAQPFSEGRAPGETTGFATRAVPVDGGFRVSGRKIFASLSEAADRHNVTCMVEGEDVIRFLGVPADAEGITIANRFMRQGTVAKLLEFLKGALLDREIDALLEIQNGVVTGPAPGMERWYRRNGWLSILAFDLAGKTRGVSAIDLLGGKKHDSVPAYDTTLYFQDFLVLHILYFSHSKCRLLVFHLEKLCKKYHQYKVFVGYFSRNFVGNNRPFLVNLGRYNELD